MSEPIDQDAATVRRASAADAAAIRRMTLAAYQDQAARLGYKPQAMTADHAIWIEEESVWVLERGTEILGVLVLLSGPDGILLYNAAIVPGERNHGLGTRLLTFAEEQARQWGAAQIILYTNESLTEIVRFCEKRGYEVYDRLAHPTRAKTWMVHLRKAIS